jgi:glycyl-tRNA synthetase beta chain
MRRAALGILRILIEKALPLNLQELISYAVGLYSEGVENPNTMTQVFDFMMERLRAWYLDKGVDSSIFNAVSAREIVEPLDFHRRLIALQHFQTLLQAHTLIAANKRVSSLLKDPKAHSISDVLMPSLFAHEAERVLFAAMEEKKQEIAPFYQAAKYSEVLTALATLQPAIDHFFDQVMVMVEDEKLRNNRLALLNQLQQLFLQIADVSLLTPAF